MRFLADHAIRGIETSTPTSYARRLRLPTGTASLVVSLDDSGDGPGVVCSARLSSDEDLPVLVALVRRLFDLDADSATIDDALRADPALAASVVLHPGVRLPGAVDAEEVLFRTLLGQQVSVAAARTVLGRVSAELTEGSGLFPTAAQFAERGSAVLRGPARRVASIVAIAEAVASGRLVLDARMPAAELIATLVEQPGIGPWTASYVAMRVLGDPDILLASDLIMLQSAQALGLPHDAKSLAEHGRRWAPWRSYAGLHLWRSIGR